MHRNEGNEGVAFVSRGLLSPVTNISKYCNYIHNSQNPERSWEEGLHSVFLPNSCIEPPPPYLRQHSEELHVVAASRDGRYCIITFCLRIWVWSKVEFINWVAPVSWYLWQRYVTRHCDRWGREHLRNACLIIALLSRTREELLNLLICTQGIQRNKLGKLNYHWR